MARTLPVANPARQETTDAEVQTLLRRLLKKLSRDPPSQRRPAAADNDEEVILEARVDDLLYQVVCTRPRDPRPQVRLSPREQEIARMVAKGYANKTIAAVLDISSWTVGTYLRRLFSKLGVCSRAAMVARLHEAHLLKP